MKVALRSILCWEARGVKNLFTCIDTFKRSSPFRYSVHDHQFGFPLQSLEECAIEGLACVTCLELEGVLSLKNSHHRPRYVLLLPLDPGEHAKRLRERGCLTGE